MLGICPQGYPLPHTLSCLLCIRKCATLGVMKLPAKLLIVDDDALLLASLKNQFEEAGYDVVTAENGEEGVKQYQAEKPAVVLMDVMMPVMDGLSMLKEIRKQDPESGVPFIVLSSATEMNYVAQAMDEGALAYLLKPDHPIDAIVGAVEEKLKHV